MKWFSISKPDPFSFSAPASSRPVSIAWRQVCFYSLLVFWSVLSFSSALAECSIAVAVVAWVLSWIQDPAGSGLKWLKANKKIAVPLACFLGIVIVSCLTSEYPSKSVRGFFKVIKQILIFLMVADTFTSKRHLEKFESLFLITTVLIVADGFFQYAFDKDFIRGFPVQASFAGPRVSASFKSYGIFASHLISIIPYALMLGLRYRNQDGKWTRWYFCFLAVAGAMTLLFLTRSRGAFLAFLIGSFIFLLFRYRQRILIVLCFVGIIMSCFYVLPTSMLIHLDGQRKEQSFVERYYLWDRAFQVVLNKPLTGTGINTYAVAHQKYDKTLSWRVQNYYAHNGYLQMAAEIGLPGLIAFLLFLFQYFRAALKRPTSGPLGSSLENYGIRYGLLCGIFNFLLFACVDTVLHNPQPVMLFWYLMGLQAAYLVSDIQSSAKHSMEYATIS